MIEDRNFYNYKLLSILVFFLLGISIALLWFCYNKNVNNELKLKKINSKLFYYEQYNFNDTIQIIKMVIERVEQDSLGFVTQHQKVIIPNVNFLKEINVSFQLKKTDIYTKYVGQIRYDLPANYVDFIQFELMASNKAKISIEFGKQKITFNLLKKNNWLINESIWIN